MKLTTVYDEICCTMILTREEIYHYEIVAG